MNERITEAEIKALIKKAEAVYVRICSGDGMHGLFLALPLSFCGTYINFTPVVTRSGQDLECGFGLFHVPAVRCVWHAAETVKGGRRGELEVLPNTFPGGSTAQGQTNTEEKSTGGLKETGINPEGLSPTAGETLKQGGAL